MIFQFVLFLITQAIYGNPELKIRLSYLFCHDENFALLHNLVKYITVHAFWYCNSNSETFIIL